MHEMSTTVIRAFAALFTGKTGLDQFSGPIGMVSGVAATAATGWTNFLTVLALISVNLGWFNLFPFPALDGGRLILLGLEGIFGLRISDKKQAIVHLVGFAAIFLLIIFVTVKDVLRFVS
jgi:regulator of sigma E protease